MQVLNIITDEDDKIKTDTPVEVGSVIYIVLKNGEEYRISDNLTELRVQNTSAPINMHIVSRSCIGITERR